MALFRFGIRPIINNIFAVYNTKPKNIYTSAALALKEIKIEQEKDTLCISGEYIPSPREKFLLKEVKEVKNFCPKCTLGLDIKHTDVLILSQYIRSDGCMMPRRITGLCKVQQKRMSKLVAMAQKAGLMCNLEPNSKWNPIRRKKFKKYNTYFEESTIKFRGRVID